MAPAWRLLHVSRGVILDFLSVDREVAHVKDQQPVARSNSSPPCLVFLIPWPATDASVIFQLHPMLLGPVNPRKNKFFNSYCAKGRVLTSPGARSAGASCLRLPDTRAYANPNWTSELLRPRVVHGGRMKCRHKPSALQTHHELFPPNTGVTRCLAQPLGGKHHNKEGL